MNEIKIKSIFLNLTYPIFKNKITYPKITFRKSIKNYSF